MPNYNNFVVELPDIKFKNLMDESDLINCTIWLFYLIEN